MTNSTSAALETRILPQTERLTLPSSLLPQAGFAALDSWMTLMGNMYRFPVYRILALTNGDIKGSLSLIHIKHGLFGNYLVTSPYASYGGFSFLSVEARDALLARAQTLGDELGVEYVNVRFLDDELDPPSGSGWAQHPVYATYRARLKPDVDALLASYSANHRNHIRKSLKKGFCVRFGGMELLDDVYEGLAKSMHELGSPYHAKSYLRGIVSSLGADVELAALYDSRSRLAGAGVFIFSGDTATNLHANILRRARPDYGGEFLYWSVIARYAQRGFATFDMGRSLVGSGNEVFKMKWNPERKLLAYWYYLRKIPAAPNLNQKNPKFRFAIWAWRHMPAFAVRLAGPALICGLA